MREALTVALNKKTIISSLKVGLFVGTALNIINQGDLLFQGLFDQINWFKTLLTYAVPFMVSTYATIKAKLTFEPETISNDRVKLRCVNCYEQQTTVGKFKMIPECPNCNENTKWKLDKT